MEPAADVVGLDEVVEFRREEVLGLLERLGELPQLVGSIVHIVLHRAERRTVEGVHHVLEQRVAGRRGVGVGLEDGFELFRALFGLVSVLDPLIDAEPPGAVARKERVELVVDPPGDA